MLSTRQRLASYEDHGQDLSDNDGFKFRRGLGVLFLAYASDGLIIALLSAVRVTYFNQY